MLSMLSEKGKPLRVFDGYKFRMGDLTKKGQKWRCTLRSCKVVMFTDPSGSIIVQEPMLHHEHLPDSNLARQFLSNNAKQKSVDDLSLRPFTTVLKEVQRCPLEIREKLNRKDLERARRNSYVSRRSAHPPLPYNLEETHEVIEDMDLRTADGENMVLINDKERNIIAFGKIKNLLFLCTLLTIYMDGTFSYAPQFFTQLFTIFGLKNGVYTPLLFCLLSSKTTESYSDLFFLIKMKCIALSVMFWPKKNSC